MGETFIGQRSGLEAAQVELGQHVVGPAGAGRTRPEGSDAQPHAGRRRANEAGPARSGQRDRQHRTDLGHAVTFDDALARDEVPPVPHRVRQTGRARYHHPITTIKKYISKLFFIVFIVIFAYVFCRYCYQTYFSVFVYYRLLTQ